MNSSEKDARRTTQTDGGVCPECGTDRDQLKRDITRLADLEHEKKMEEMERDITSNMLTETFVKLGYAGAVMMVGLMLYFGYQTRRPEVFVIFGGTAVLTVLVANGLREDTDE